jgi:hypothetical protein
MQVVDQYPAAAVRLPMALRPVSRTASRDLRARRSERMGARGIAERIQRFAFQPLCPGHRRGTAMAARRFVMRKFAVTIGLVALQACASSDVPGLTEKQQDEVIEVHGCQPGYIEVGDGEDRVCVDPWHGDGPDPADGGGRGGREPSTPGGGGNTQPQPPPPQPPKPRPTPHEDCSDYDHPADCKECCERNYWNIDVPECQQHPSSLCWETAILVYGKCKHDCEPKKKPCPRCITTTREP